MMRNARIFLPLLLLALLISNGRAVSAPSHGSCTRQCCLHHARTNACCARGACARHSGRECLCAAFERTGSTPATLPTGAGPNPLLAASFSVSLRVTEPRLQRAIALAAPPVAITEVPEPPPRG